MRPVRMANTLLRVILAVSFGFMSLGHGPVMAFAKAKASSAGREMPAAPIAAHHHHHHGAAPATAAEQEPLAAPVHERAAVCYSAGCFVAVAPVAAGAPDSRFSLLEQLRAAPARALIPSILDPLVPPPRLQA
jgi:hypothetical protein